MDLLSILKEFGLSTRQAKVYLACLELGESTVSQIADKAQIERTGTYYVLASLQAKSLVTNIEKGKKDYFVAVEPKQLLDIAKRQEELIKNHLGEFEAFANISTNKPHVRLYSGIEGIKTVFNKTIEKRKTIMLGFSPYQTAEKTAWYNGKEYVGWGLDYIRRRADKQVFARTIAEESDQSRKRKENDPVELRETRIVPSEKFLFTNEIVILDDWVAVISYKEMVALTIDSPEFTKTMKSVFELAWEGAERYQG